VTRGFVAIVAVTLTGACLSRTAAIATPHPQLASTPVALSTPTLQHELDEIFRDPVLARALMAVDVVSLRDGRTVYALNADALVMPASNMKLVTIAVAASRLGWNYRYRTTLEAAGTLDRGVLHGDITVTGSGDPSIGSPDGGHAQLFLDWADALATAGITRVDGRIIGDDDAFDDDGLGAGWAWDYLTAGYAAPVGALSYNENVVVLRIAPAASAGPPAIVTAAPAGADLEIARDVATGDAGATATIELSRAPGSNRLLVRGRVPAGASPLVRTTTVHNPTRYFVEALRLALASRGITTSGGAWDIDDVPRATLPATPARRMIAAHESEPLSTLAGYAMKVSQNFYGETFFKTMGRKNGQPGTAEGGRRAVRDALTTWGIPLDGVVMYDGSGLSRYNYLTARTIVDVLRRVWSDESLRGPFVADLPVGGRDGTLETRMKDTDLDRRVQAKTGSINNVRALSGFVEDESGEKFAFSMIANNYTAPNVVIDGVVEKALRAIVRRDGSSTVLGPTSSVRPVQGP